MGSTTSSPRMPCALRTRPTITNSASVLDRAGALMRLPLGGAALGGLGAVAQRHRARRERAAEPLLVTGLEDAGAPKKRAHGVRREGAIVEPVIHAIGQQVDRVLTLSGSVLPDDLDELPVSRATGVGDDDAVHRGALATRAAKTNSNSHGPLLVIGAW